MLALKAVETVGAGWFFRRDGWVVGSREPRFCRRFKGPFLLIREKSGFLPRIVCESLVARRCNFEKYVSLKKISSI